MRETPIESMPKTSVAMLRNRAIFWSTILVIVFGYSYYVLANLTQTNLCDTEPGNEFLWYTSFLARTFDFHVGLLFLGLAIVAVIARRFVIAAAVLPLCLIGLEPTIESYWLHYSGADAKANLRVMTVNLLWVNRNTAPIIDEILAENPDLLLLQEYTPIWHLAMQNALTETYPYYFGHPTEEAFGTAIYSKHPLSDPFRSPGAIPGDRSPFFRSTVRVADWEVALYCVHIVPPSWTNRILMRRQFCELYDALKQEQRPMLVGGDFNFTRRAEMDEKLQSLGLAEAHAQSGIGRGATFKIPWLPDIGIDHVYMSSVLTPIKCRTGIGRGSDHRPVVVDMLVRPAIPSREITP